MDPDTSGPEQRQAQTPLQMLLKARNGPEFGDTVLISSLGERFYTYKGLLFKRSNVFKDMFEQCGKPASGDGAKSGVFELKLPDVSAEIEAATTYIHDTDEFWSAIEGSEFEEQLQVLGNLVSFASKYDMPGATPLPPAIPALITDVVECVNIKSAGNVRKCSKLGRTQCNPSLHACHTQCTPTIMEPKGWLARARHLNSFPAMVWSGDAHG